MKRRSRNRKSILAEEAQRHGIDVPSSAQRPPRPTQQLGHSMLGAATPVSGFGSQIPRRFNLETPASTTGSKRNLPSFAPGTMCASARLGRVGTSRKAGSMRRSYSTEFLLHGSISRTPRSRTQSPGSFQISGSTSRLNAISAVDPVGSVKYPDFKELKVLDGMAMKVSDKLKLLRYPSKQFTAKEVKDMSSRDFNAVSLWLIERLWAPYTGAKNTKEELKFIQSSLGPGKLTFPATVNVTCLSNPNTSAGRPYALTILFFLTCLLEDYEVGCEEVEEEHEKPDWLLFETYAQMLSKLSNNEHVDVDEKMQIFSERLDQCLGTSDLLDTQDLEELSQELQEQQAKLASLHAAPDPRQEFLSTIRSQEAKITELEAQFKDTELASLKYKDVSALKNEERVLELELQRAKRRLAEMQDRVKKQSLSVEEAAELVQITKTLQREQETLMKIITEISQKKEKLLQFVENDEKRCYEELSKLSIVDEYNNEAKKWAGVVPTIITNPLRLEELPNWIRIVDTNLKQAKSAMEEKRAQLKEAMLVSQNSKQILEAEVAQNKKRFEQLRSDRNQRDGDLLARQNKLSKELAELKRAEEKKFKELADQTATLNLKQSEIAEDAIELESDKIKIAELKECLRLWEEELECQHTAFRTTAMKKVGELSSQISGIRAQMEEPIDLAAIEAEVKAELATKLGIEL